LTSPATIVCNKTPSSKSGDAWSDAWRTESQFPAVRCCHRDRRQQQQQWRRRIPVQDEYKFFDNSCRRAAARFRASERAKRTPEGRRTFGKQRSRLDGLRGIISLYNKCEC
jgi:hypothetical protein